MEKIWDVPVVRVGAGIFTEEALNEIRDFENQLVGISGNLRNLQKAQRHVSPPGGVTLPWRSHFLDIPRSAEGTLRRP